jgi:hypothetical protein
MHYGTGNDRKEKSATFQTIGRDKQEKFKIQGQQ